MSRIYGFYDECKKRHSAGVGEIHFFVICESFFVLLILMFLFWNLTIKTLSRYGDLEIVDRWSCTDMDG